MVGSALARHFSGRHEVHALKHGDLDITNFSAVMDFASRARPDVMINCAVVDVDTCERDPSLAESVNAAGPMHLAKAAAEIGSEIVLISTNYVFDGKRESEPYTWLDEPRPINIYGKTKYAGELAVMSAMPRSYIIRTSWVFGPGKENFLSTVHKKLLEGTGVRAIEDVFANATFVEDLALRIGEILNMRHGIYHVVNEGTCTYHDFANEAAHLIGLSLEKARSLVLSIKTSEAQWIAPRPRYTPLRCLLSEELGLKPMRHWHEALGTYISSR